MPLCRHCSTIQFKPCQEARPKGQLFNRLRRFSAQELVRDLNVWRRKKRYKRSTGFFQHYVTFLPFNFDQLGKHIENLRKTGSICELCEMIHDVVMQIELERKLESQSKPSGYCHKDGTPRWKPRVDMLTTKEGPDWNHAMRRSENIWLRISNYYDSIRWDLNIGLSPFLHVGRKELHLENCVQILRTRQERISSVPTTIPTEEPGRSMPKSTYLSDDNTGSDRAVDLAKSWIQLCLEKHDDCRAMAVDMVPSRLLDLEPGKDEHGAIRLVDGLDVEETAFVTLSHKWGIWFPISTTILNQAQHQAGLLIEHLPKTFQDAVSVTKRLGYRYLWIDSLCILQDCPEEVARELPRMGHYYRNAIFNIAAHAALDCRGGLFQRRNGFSLRPQTIRFRDPTLIDNPPFVYMTIAPTLADSNDIRYSTSLLQQRAWVLQEQLFAHRTLNFERCTISFQCVEMYASETMPRGRLHTSNIFLSNPPPMPEVQTFNKTTAIFPRIIQGHTSPDQKYELWYRTVEMYSPRNLTYQHDRLAAISGVAAAFAQALHGDKYIAGLWEGDLVRALCWYATSLAKRQLTYVAPTWSWANLDSTDLHFETWLCPSNYEGESHYLAAEVISVTTTPRTDNPYGALKEARLSISGRVISYLLHQHPHNKNPLRQYSISDPLRGSQRVIDDLTRSITWLDVDVEMRDNKMLVSVLPLIKDQNGASRCLVLSRLETGEYERIGYTVYLEKDWRPKNEAQTITII